MTIASFPRDESMKFAHFSHTVTLFGSIDTYSLYFELGITCPSEVIRTISSFASVSTGDLKYASHFLRFISILILSESCKLDLGI